MFTIDFQKPFLYKDVIYFNQGNLSTNNILRCKVVTGGDNNLEGYICTATFKTLSQKEINVACTIVDTLNCIIDIKFPSNALEVGLNKLEILLTKGDGNDRTVAQSPAIMYEVWQGLTTGAGIDGDSNYPILIDLIADVNNAIRIANNANATAGAAITQTGKLIEETQNVIEIANTTIENTFKAKNDLALKVDGKIREFDSKVLEVNSKIAEVDTSKNNMIADTKEAISDMKNEVNIAIAGGTQDLELKQARVDADNVEHATLKERLDSDVKKGNITKEAKEGSYLTFYNTLTSPITEFEILGNTIQDPNTLKITSAGIAQGDGTRKMSILSANKNLFDGAYTENKRIGTDGSLVVANGYNVTDLIRVPNTSVCGNLGNDNYFAWYDKDKNFIKRDVKVEKYCNIPIEAKYVQIASNINFNTLIIEEGTQSTPYIPHERNKSDILLEFGLDGFGGVEDRVYFDKELNAWCVEKYSHNYSDSDRVNIPFSILANTYRFCININKNIGSKTMYCNKLKCVEDYNLDEEHCYINIGKNINQIWIFVNKSTIDNYEGIDVPSKITKYLKESGITLIIALSNPQKIVLPNSTQILLNSFANTTHCWIESGEAQATIKATVSKSLASTVENNTNEINNLNAKFNDLNGLKESQDFSYQCEGSLVCKNTKNGSVKDLKVYGRTLNNICDNTPFTYSGIYPNRNFINWKMLEPSVEYTFVLLGDFSNAADIMISDGAMSEQILPRGSYGTVFTFKAPANISTFTKQQKIYCYKSGETPLTEIQVNSWKILILEGDHTKNPPPFFTGLKSVGEDVDKIEVLTKNANIVYFDNAPYYKPNSLSYNLVNPNTITIFKSSGANYDAMAYLLDVKPNTNYRISSDFINEVNTAIVAIKDFNTGATIIDITSNANNKIFNSGNRTKVKIQLYPSYNVTNGSCTFANVFVGEEKSLFALSRSDKKPLLYKDTTTNTWKPIPMLTEFDVVDSVNGKWYKRGYKEVFDGSSNENWSLVTTNTNTLQFQCDGALIGGKTLSKLINNLFIQDNRTAVDLEGITSSSSLGSRIYIRINKSKLETQDVVGFKKWLQANNVTVIYELAQEEVYDISPLALDAYADETMIFCSSGPVQAPMSFKLTSSLPNFLAEVEKRVSRIEEDYYKSNLANFAIGLNALNTKLIVENMLKTPK